MPLLGFGQQPFGNTSAGTGTPLNLPLPGSAGYITSTDIVPVRAINTRTKDYDLDTTTAGYDHKPWNIAEQQVLLALQETPGRLSYWLDGGDQTNALGTIPTIETVRGYTQGALRALIQAGTIELLDVSITNTGAALFRVVTWRDTTSKAVIDTTAKLK